MTAALDAEAYRDALRHNTFDTTCYRHQWANNRHGGATCTRCGTTIDKDEL